MSSFSSVTHAGQSSLGSLANSAVADNIGKLLGNLSLQQHARLIRLDGTPVPVLVERFKGQEGLDTLFHFEVDVIVEMAGLAMADWGNKELQLTLIDPSGKPMLRHGRVVAMSEIGSDGGFSRYRVTLMPWAFVLDNRQDAWVFQDKTVLDIATELFADYPEANWRKTVTQPLRKRSLCIQYLESDWAFICRLFAEEGLSFVFEHLDAAGGASGDSALSRCRLHVFDSKAQLDDAGEFRFGQVSAALADDRFTRFERQTQAQPTRVQHSSWDYRKLHAPAGSASSTQPKGELASLEDYDGSEAYRFDDAEQAERIATLRQLAYDGAAEGFVAEGAVRALRPAQVFTLLDHADYRGRRFVVRSMQHQGANNLQSNVGGGQQAKGVEAGSYRHQLTCQAIERPLAPMPRLKPIAPTQTALVVGIADSPLRSDRHHRIKVQFGWQRGKQPNSGGMAHPAGDNAPGNEAGFTWVRLAEWLAGPNWGTQFTPRVGDEVLINFIDGDIDRPLVVGSAYNDQATPPYAAGHDGPANHAGHLSGFHSQTLDGADYNRWVMDDTPGQLRSQLKTSRQDTELNLGHLVAQPAFAAQRGRYRGEGVELRTDGWGNLRGEAGLLFSSHTQAQANQTQLAAHATQAQIKAAETLVQQLGDTATTHHALAIHSQDAIKQLHQQISEHTGAVNGQAAQQPDPEGDGRQLKDPVETLQDSPAVLETPNTLAAITEGSHLLYASGDIQAQGRNDVQLTALHNLTVQAGNRLGLFTHHGGMKLIAAEGDLHLAAHTDLLHLASEQALTLTSTDDSIEITAQNSITLFGGGAAVELKGTNITFKARGEFMVKGNSDAMPGGMEAGSLPALPTGAMGLADTKKAAAQPPTHWIELDYRDPVDGHGIGGAEYEIHFDGGPVLTGTLDDNGKARREGVPGKTVKKIIYKPRKPDTDKPYAPLNDLLG
ncbi:type VI secretion system Vgr family protein [Chitinimonas sp. BJB300]|uniref:type VI secretion system Vgr family protein n=1 Tax=Chitinimonas sp. BJB300 TaxID=1559339 RepID=UPI000C0D3641|nr:type VI secretion system tip protein TssI/VgrG [Chitinimonas sp. BJB300]PHV11076.1 type VI secretion system tip protein VgrG [Chitinimonas sp. BJB300]TSJ91517.1 type VI secretion system tip protein VgrG [Chitinimonas sp. BJB300]